MYVNRRQFITNSTVSTAGLVAACAFGAAPLLAHASDGQTLSHADIQNNDDLRHVYKAISDYGSQVRMSRRGAQIMVRTRIRKIDAFRDCYSASSLTDGPVKALPGNRMVFARNRVEFIVDHMACMGGASPWT